MLAKAVYRIGWRLPLAVANHVGSVEEMVTPYGFKLAQYGLRLANKESSDKERNFTGEQFWARGYAVSTIGFELEQVRQYIREQQGADGATGRF